MLLLAGCATVKNPANWNMDEELGVFTAPTHARFSQPPVPVPEDDGHSAARVEPPPEADANAIGGVARVGVIFADRLVGGLEFEGGGVQSTATDFQSTDGALHLGLSAVVGVVQRIGPLALGAELVGGMRKLEMHKDEFKWWFLEKDSFVEARLRAHIWLTSWIALGAYVAFDPDGSVNGGGIRVIGAIPHSEYRHRRSK